jgi:hypothetical protein
LERARKEDEVVKLRLRRIRLVVRGLQMICSYVFFSGGLIQVGDCCFDGAEFDYVYGDTAKSD